MASAWEIYRSALGPAASYQLPSGTCETIAWNKTNPDRQKVAKLKTAWQVKQLYYVEDLGKIYTQVYRAAATAYNAWLDGGSGGQLDDSEGWIKTVAKLGDSLKVTGPKFAAAYRDAKATGAKAIDAPDFKTWAIDTLNLTVAATYYSEYAKCRVPALDRAMEALLAVLTAAIDAVMAIVVALKEVVVAVGDTVVSVFSGVAFAITVAKWAVILGGGAFVVYKGKQFYDRRRASLPAGDE